MIKNLYEKILIEEPFPIYLEKCDQYLSSHQLMDFARCPKLYHLKRTGALTVDPNKNSADMILGRAAHTLILEGRTVFDQSYAVGGPINDKTGKEFGRETQTYAKWLADQKAEKGSALEAITTDQWYVISNMAQSVKAHVEASRLLKYGVAERVVRTSLLDVPVQIRIDWLSVNDLFVHIVDLKTCNDLDAFVYDARKYLYGIQFAFYRTVFEEACRVEYGQRSRTRFFAIATEKKEPFRVGVFEVADDTLDRYEKKNAELINAFRECRNTNEWPTLYEDVRLLEIQ